MDSPRSFTKNQEWTYPHALLDHITGIHLKLRLELILVSRILRRGLVNPRAIDLLVLFSSGGKLT